MIRKILLTALAIWLMLHLLAFVMMVIIVIMEDVVYGHSKDE